jgi:hypothetical protein
MKGKPINDVFTPNELVVNKDYCWRRYMGDRPCYLPHLFFSHICVRAFKPISMQDECEQCLKDHPSLSEHNAA